MTADLVLARSVIADLAAELFDRPVMGNLARPAYVERLVARALLPTWRHVGSDWAGWDLESEAGARLEVKQSAVRQSWTEGPARLGKPMRAVFDVAQRTGYFTDGGSRWVPAVLPTSTCSPIIRSLTSSRSITGTLLSGRSTSFPSIGCPQRTARLAWRGSRQQRSRQARRP